MAVGLGPSLVTGSTVIQERPSQRLLAVLGVLWLLLAAAIILFQYASATPIKIEWETETEVETAGFNIYRSEAEAEDFQRINERLIPSRGGPVSGAVYSFVDENVEVGKTYFYRLEDVELDNSTEMHEVVEITAPSPAWWVPVTAAFSVVCGLLLLLKGLQ